MEVRTVLVEPKSETNVGAVARVLKNFGFHDLYLVNPPHIGIKALSVASHAHDLLTRARIVSSIEEAVSDACIVAGTTAKRGISASKHLRMPALSPYELKEKTKDKGGILALLFGREDIGLLNEELKRCDIVVSIPTAPDYPVMNLSHAVAVLLYELSNGNSNSSSSSGSSGGVSSSSLPSSKRLKLASVEDKERLFNHIRTFLDEIEYREHKKEKTMVMLRRLFGRAGLTAREVQRLRGILRKAEWKIKADHRR